MYSIKPGRGPSMMGGFGGIIAAIFGVFWIGAASRMGAPGFMTLFGVVFVIVAIMGAVYNFYNATQRERMSQFDITTPHEESDPVARAMGIEPDSERDEGPKPKPRRFEGSFCPYCGSEVRPEFDYCPKCGKDI